MEENLKKNIYMYTFLNHFAIHLKHCKPIILQFKKRERRDFPGDAVVKNPPANAGTRVRALVWEDPTCRGATKPVCHNY